MRTRFLNVDYFNSASIQATETLEFLRLPLPQLPPSNLSNFEDIRCFDDVSALDVSLEIDRFQIHESLSKFFSDVLPHTINVEIGDLTNTQSYSPKYCFDEQKNFSSQKSVEIRVSEKEAVVPHEEKKVGSQRNLGPETVQFELPKKENGPSFYADGKNSFEFSQFETPELDLFVETACIFEKEDMQIFSEVLEVQNIPDTLNPGLTVQYPFEIQESVYSVDDITPKYHMEQKACLLEDDASLGDQFQFYHGTFPLLEVDEISLGIFANISMEDEFLLLENIDPQDWTQKDEIVVDGKELLGSTDIDLLEYLSDHCLSKQCLESELACLKVFLEIDFLSVIELSYVEGNSAIHPETVDDNFVLAVSLFLFEDLQFLDLNSSQVFEVFLNSQTVNEPEMCEQMFRKDMNVKNFDELIISHELTLVDDYFKSLPVPILSDHEKIRSLYAFVDEMLAELKPQASSASDSIYLDWHLFEDDKYNLDLYSCSKIFEVDTYSIDSDLKSIDDGMLVLNFVFFGDAPNVPNTEEKKEMLNMPYGGILEIHGGPNEIASSKLLDDGFQERGNGEVLININADNASSLVQSMSQFNDLDFFLNPREASIGKISKPADKTSDIKATCPMVSCSDSVAACDTAVARLQQWETKLYQIKLSDDILAVIDNFQKSYLTILKNDTELTNRQYSFLDADNFKFLSIPKEKLMDCIKKTSAHATSLGHGDDNGMAFVTLCAIKQMAWYLCYYGIHITYLYAGKLCRNLESLRCKLSSLQTLIEDEHEKANKDITKSHPSLSVIQEILQSNINQGGLRVLIVADQVFWWPLRRLLTSMKISFNELKNFHTHLDRLDVCHSNKFTDVTMDAVRHSDCSFISHEHVSASFPFDKYGIILEYGGSCASSRVSTISPNLVCFPRLHFLKMELEDSSIPKALCEGVVMPQNLGFTMKGDPHSITTLSENNQKLEELLNYLPVEEKYNMGSFEPECEVEACSMPLQVPCVPLNMESKQIYTSMHSFPDTVIIVNTQNFEKEMIISRRSTYQKILAMEKEGAQVVERDLNLPVDVIISAAVCLAWYDCRNIGKKATAPDEASSCLSLCVENIAANVLTSLSFAFSGCILIFEGESSFLAAILESSDELYAAAASLGMDLQLFCSYSSELTDEIIVSCIGNTTKLTTGIYPKMPESETLAESFLTTFPSINPLSAHAILSSGGMLVEFLEWSHEHRIQAIQKYHVPVESVSLLSALCRYGEREDSKSGMTDCSSSVSSVPDSENYHCKSDSGRKKRKCIGSPHKMDILMEDLFHFEPLKQFTNGILDPPGVSKPYESWMSQCPGIFDEIEKPTVASNGNFFGQQQGSGVDTMMSPSRVCKPYDSRMPRGPEISDEIETSSLTLNDNLFGQKEGLNMAPMNKLDWGHNNNSENLQDDFIGEVIDIHHSSSSGGDFSSMEKSIGFSTLVPEMEQLPAAGNFRTARKLSFSSSCHPTFPTAAEINSDSNVWISAKNNWKSSREGINQHSDTDFNNDNLPLKHKALLEEGSMQKTATNFQSLSFQEKDKSQYGGTPLSKAIRSAQPQKGSPWTIEFLNRIREKSRLRQQSLPCDMSQNCFSYSANTFKVTKRKSPSILDFYKYQGGSTPKKIIDQKRQKRSTQPSSSSKREKTSAPPTWTPTDKRARQTLSFATNGGGGQSKLIWSDNNVHGLSDKNAHTLNR